jgi:hypothetical protein
MARLIGTLALALVLSPLVASAQLATADAGNFMGSWVLSLDSPQGPFEQNVVVKDEAGKAVAEITSQIQPDAMKVTDVTKDKESLILKFAGNFQGNAFDAVVTMTPDGTDKVKVLFDVNAGQFSMSGTGVKK